MAPKWRSTSQSETQTEKPVVPPTTSLYTPEELLGPQLGSYFPFSHFNKIQSTVAPILLSSSSSSSSSSYVPPSLHVSPTHDPDISRSENVIIGAPTGSGKTVLLELAIISLFRDRLLAAKCGNQGMENNGQTNTTVKKSKKTILPLKGDCGQKSNVSRHTEVTKKAVYICPIKALAQEKFTTWCKKFKGVLRVVVETGDGLQVGDDDNDKDSPFTSSRFNSQAGQGKTTTTPSSGSNTKSSNGRDTNSYIDPLHSLDQILLADIIITTPERWDSITRRWKDGQLALTLVASIGLLLVDEVHVVGDRRGAVLEALVSRMKTVQMALKQDNSHLLEAMKPISNGAANLILASPPTPSLRFIAVSGTIPNIDDLAEWLEVPSQNIFTFGEEDRPVPLKVKVIGFRSVYTNPFSFDRFLTMKLFSLVQEYSDGKPCLVFCSSRRETTVSAQQLSDDIALLALSQKQGDNNNNNNPPQKGFSRGGKGGKWNNNANSAKLAEAYKTLENLSKHLVLPDGRTNMYQISQSAEDKILRKCLLAGIGFHNAAMTQGDRRLVEELFSSHYVSALCTTTTLAMGVNLPARLVIIKGTTFYRGGCREDLPSGEITQMAGRAGRAGLDTEGVALILTSQDKTSQYQHLQNTSSYPLKTQGVSSPPPLESHLHHAMIEHLNAEIMLNTVASSQMGVEWLKTTFLWVRLKKNPSHYGLGGVGGNTVGVTTYSGSRTLLSTVRKSTKLDLHNNNNANVESNSVNTECHKVLECFASNLISNLVYQLLDENCIKATPVMLSSSEEQGINVNVDVECDADEKPGVLLSIPSPFSHQTTSEGLLSLSSSSSVNQHGNVEKKPNFYLTPTRLGRLVAKYYIAFDTVITFNKMLLWKVLPKSLVAELRTDGFPNFTSNSTSTLSHTVINADSPSSHSSSSSGTSSSDSSSSSSSDDESESSDMLPMANPSPTTSPHPYPNNKPQKDQQHHSNLISFLKKRHSEPYHITIRHLLEILCHASEFSELPIRLGDKGVLNQHNKVQKFPLNAAASSFTASAANDDDDNGQGDTAAPGKPTKSKTSSSTRGRELKEGWQKIFLLLQMKVSDASLELISDDFSLRNDVARLWQAIPRLSRFLTEYCSFVVAEAGRLSDFQTMAASDAFTRQSASVGMLYVVPCAHLIYNSWNIQRTIERALWWDSSLLTKQLDGVGDVLSRALASKGEIRDIEGVITYFSPSSSTGDLEPKQINNNNNITGAHPDAIMDLPRIGYHARRLELLCGKTAPFGTNLLNQCLEIPRFIAVIPSNDETKSNTSSREANHNKIPIMPYDSIILARRVTRYLTSLFRPGTPLGDSLIARAIDNTASSSSNTNNSVLPPLSYYVGIGEVQLECRQYTTPPSSFFPSSASGDIPNSSRDASNNNNDTRHNTDNNDGISSTSTSSPTPTILPIKYRKGYHTVIVYASPHVTSSDDTKVNSTSTIVRSVHTNTHGISSSLSSEAILLQRRFYVGFSNTQQNKKETTVDQEGKGQGDGNINSNNNNNNNSPHAPNTVDSDKSSRHFRFQVILPIFESLSQQKQRAHDLHHLSTQSNTHSEISRHPVGNIVNGAQVMIYQQGSYISSDVTTQSKSGTAVPITSVSRKGTLDPSPTRASPPTTFSIPVTVRVINEQFLGVDDVFEIHVPVINISVAVQRQRNITRDMEDNGNNNSLIFPKNIPQHLAAIPPTLDDFWDHSSNNSRTVTNDIKIDINSKDISFSSDVKLGEEKHYFPETKAKKVLINPKSSKSLLSPHNFDDDNGNEGKGQTASVNIQENNINNINPEIATKRARAESETSNEVRSNKGEYTIEEDRDVSTTTGLTTRLHKSEKAHNTKDDNYNDNYNGNYNDNDNDNDNYNVTMKNTKISSKNTGSIVPAQFASLMQEKMELFKKQQEQRRRQHQTQQVEEGDHISGIFSASNLQNVNVRDINKEVNICGVTMNNKGDISMVTTASIDGDNINNNNDNINDDNIDNINNNNIDNIMKII